MFTALQQDQFGYNGVYTNMQRGRGRLSANHRRDVEHGLAERDPYRGGADAGGGNVTLSSREWPGRHVYVEADRRPDDDGL